MALGKNTTAAKVEDIVRVRTGTMQDPILTPALMLDIINQRVADLAKRLNDMNAPFYQTTATLSSWTSNVASLASYSIDRIIKLVDGTNGVVKQVGSEEFEHIQTLTTNYAASVFFVHEGENITRWKGSAVSAWGTLTLHYYAVPTAAAARANYPDIPDSFTALLIDMVAADVLAYKNGGMRDANLEASIARQIEDAYRAYGVREAKK